MSAGIAQQMANSHIKVACITIASVVRSPVPPIRREKGIHIRYGFVCKCAELL